MALSKPVAQAISLTIPANSATGPIGLASSTFLRCLSSTIAGTLFSVQLDQAPPLEMDQGIAAYCAPGDSFQAINVTNPTGSAITLILEFGQGNVTDNRLSVSGTLNTQITQGGNIANVLAAANALQTVQVTATGSAVSFNNGVSGSTTQRITIANDEVGNALDGGAGSSFATNKTQRVIEAWDNNPIGTSVAASVSYATGSTTIVAPASNTNGMTVNTASLLSGSGVGIYAGTSAPSSLLSNPGILVGFNNGPGLILPEQIYLPAGQGLYVYTAAGGSAAMTYTIH